jgi:hypothetical protein
LYLAEWWPDSHDSVAWHVDLVSTEFPAFGISGSATPGLTWLRSMNELVADGFETPNDVKTSQDWATPHGRVRQLCAASGIYKLTASFSENLSQRRAGGFMVYDGGAVNERLYTVGFDRRLQAYFAVGYDPALMPPAAASEPVIALASAQPGWAGCAARNGTRVLSLFVGQSVFHVGRDVSWRVRTAFIPQILIPLAACTAASSSLQALEAPRARFIL